MNYQNDPGKTVCATMFIVSVIQHIKIGDLSMHHSGVAFTGDTPGDEMMDIDTDDRLPDGTEPGESPTLSREEERSLVRDSTAGFAGRSPMPFSPSILYLNNHFRLGDIFVPSRFFPL